MSEQPVEPVVENPPPDTGAQPEPEPEEAGNGDDEADVCPVCGRRGRAEGHH